jgi:hypothetical protein
VEWLLGSLVVGAGVALAALGLRRRQTSVALVAPGSASQPRKLAWSWRWRLYFFGILGGGAAIEIAGNPWKDRVLAFALGYVAVYAVIARRTWRRWRADPAAAAMELHAKRFRQPPR